MTAEWLQALQANPDLLDNFLAYLDAEEGRIALALLRTGQTAEDLAEARGQKKLLDYLRQTATLEAREERARVDYAQRSRGR